MSRHNLESEPLAAKLETYRQPAQRALAVARTVFMPLAVAFIAYVAWSSRDLLSSVLRDANPTLVAVAVALWFTLHFNVPWFDLQIMRALGHGTGYGTLRDIYLSRLPTKYLPGGIWHNVSRLVDLNRVEVPKPFLTTLAILQIAVPASVAFLAGGSLLIATQGTTRWGFIGLVAALAAVVVVLVAPAVLNRTILRRRGRLETVGYLRAVGASAIFWIIASAAFVAYISAYSVVAPGTARAEVAGSYLIAWGTGFISLFTPQGFGVFEVTAATLLPSLAEFRLVVTIVAGFRLVVLAADALGWVGFHLVRRLLPTTSAGR